MTKTWRKRNKVQK